MGDAEKEQTHSLLTALLGLIVEGYASGEPQGRRSPDQILAQAGLPTKDIATILGKSQRAVQLALEKGRRGPE